MALRLACAAALLAGCARYRAPVPMQSLKYQLAPHAKCLVVLLPGGGDDMTAFEDVGQVQIFHESGLSVDVVASNAFIGYYLSNTVLPRLHDDVIAPAQASGHYQHTWLVGPSLGGFGALFYAEHHPGEVDGIIAFAPYLGDEPVLKEIRDSGGLKKWSAPAVEPVSQENFQWQLWRWLQDVTSGQTNGPEIYVAWGLSDRLGPADELLAEALPPGHSMTTQGTHDWPPWNLMLAKLVKASSLAAQCAP
jgi:S-formylglutathione hydrolase FrmB